MNNQKQRAFIQLLNEKKNKDLLFRLRVKAGLPQYGIDWTKGGMDLSKYDIRVISEHFGAYKAMLSHINQKHFDTFVSQDETVNNFLQEYFIFNQVQDETLKNINLTGCELFSLPELINVQKDNTLLPKGLYLRIGTNNTVKNVKDFIGRYSVKILEEQKRLSKEKPVRLKPFNYYLRDNFIANFSKYSTKTLLEMADKYGYLEEVKNNLKNKKIERKETILQAYVKNIFNQKLSTGSIRKIISKKSK
ncbi:MAG: hypothetical protein WAY88_00255 [Minisyncoccia bacterium]